MWPAAWAPPRIAKKYRDVSKIAGADNFDLRARAGTALFAAIVDLFPTSRAQTGHRQLARVLLYIISAGQDS
jgi:hypothetical protein